MAMPLLQGKNNPSDYVPNPTDDRLAVAAGVGEAYRALASAIEELEGLTGEVGSEILDKKVRQPVRSATSALRRAAYALIVYHA